MSIILMGLPAPVLLTLLGWWGLIPWHVSSSVFYIVSASIGFAAGVVLDVTLLRRFMTQLFHLPLPALCTLMGFYSILLYGFFMGFPVFNIIPGILGGYITAKGSFFRAADKTDAQRTTRRMDAFSFVLLFFLCAATAVLTLREPTIQLQLKSMLSLPFEVTYSMIWGVIISGGAALLALQYLLSRIFRRHIHLKYSA